MIDPSFDGLQFPMDIGLGAQSISNALEELEGEDDVHVHTQEVSVFDMACLQPW